MYLKRVYDFYVMSKKVLNIYPPINMTIAGASASCAAISLVHGHRQR